MDLGILANDEKLDPKGLGILQTGLGLLSAGGPSRMPVSLGQAIGQAGQQGMNAYQQAIMQQRQMQQLAMQKALQDAQIKKYTADAAKDQQEADIRSAQMKYLSSPEIQKLLTDGNAEQVLAGMPGQNPQNIIQLAGIKSASADRKMVNDRLIAESNANREFKDQQARVAAQEKANRDRENAQFKKDIFDAQIAGKQETARLIQSMRPQNIQPLVQIMDNGVPKWVTREDAIGKTPAGAGSKAEAVESGKRDVDVDVFKIKSALDSLKEGKGITDTERGVLRNIGAWAESTGLGQTIEGAVGSNNQKLRDEILMIRPSLLRSIMQSTGMSAKQMDSNAELKLWLSTATDPQKSYQANITALNNIATKYGSGPIIDSANNAYRDPNRTVDDQITPKPSMNPKPKLSAQDNEALNWANSNPNDPRAAQIKRSLGR